MCENEDERKQDALWNSDGATTSTVMIGSRMIGFAALYTSRNAPIVASLNASSDESTECARPSFRTSRAPHTGLPESEPFSSAS